MQDQENDITDEVNPLEAVITGMVILSFGLLYWLLNGGFGFDTQANTSPMQSTYVAADQSQRNDKGLNFASSGLALTTTPKVDEQVPTKPLALAEQVEVAQKTDQSTLDAIAIVEAQAKRQTADTVKQVEAFRVASKQATDEQAKLLAINTEEMARQQSMLDKLNKRITVLESDNQALQAELAEVNKPVIAESSNEPVIAEAPNEPVTAESSNANNTATAQDTPTSFVERFADAIAQKRTNVPIIFDDVIFDSGSSRLAPQSKEQMRIVAELLKENPDIKILIRGHTDNIGSIESNTVLSITRSNSVRNELIERGINGDRLAIEGVGLFEPIATNNTEEGRRKNRRIELIIVE